MISKYGIFCEAVKTGSFTKVAEKLNYSQSAVSQSVKALESELGADLVVRDKKGIVLTSDGKEYFPYIRDIYNAEKSLEKKRSEMLGLENNIIRIGAFTSVSRTVLPALMSNFKILYPSVKFELYQGDYTGIAEWIKEHRVDFGFINADAVKNMQVKNLFEDEMFAVLPKGHPLAAKKEISLAEISDEPFILLDEGSYSLPLKAFAECGVSPHVEYKVYDDYSIFEMVRKHLGISLIYGLVLSGMDSRLEVRPVKEHPRRTIALAWENRGTVPLAARKFMRFIIESVGGEDKKNALSD